MKELIYGTTAYSVFSNDAKSGKLSHAYMLYFNDVKNLRPALKIFALKFFGLNENDGDGKRLLNETLTDCRISPEEGKKLNADAVGELLSDSALQPLERQNKLYVISGFNEASALLQNKLLKILEEPPRGVYFLLGVTSLAPVLDTVKSRVKTLTVPPFTVDEIFSALQRKGQNPLNAEAAKSCGGILGEAENMVEGGWFKEISDAAREICTVTKISEIGKTALKYGDVKNKTQLIMQIALNYRNALNSRVNGGKPDEVGRAWLTPTLIYAVESADKACADLKFNAFFQGLLYDFMLRIIEENDKWLKLQE